MKKILIFLFSVAVAIIIVISFKTSNLRKVITDTEFTQETARQYNNTENENINVIDPDTDQLLPGAMMIKREKTLSEKCIYYFTTSNGRWDLLTRCLPYLFLLFLILYIGVIFIYYKFGHKKE